jgi:glycine cleavage system regulatory protein
MSMLGNDFAILLRVTTPDELDAAKLKELLQADFGEFAIGVRATPASPSNFNAPVRILSIAVEGPDQPGIVQTITKIFVDLKGSVRDLDTDSSNAPFAGYKIFQLKCVVAFPIDVSRIISHMRSQCTHPLCVLYRSKRFSPPASLCLVVRSFLRRPISRRSRRRCTISRTRTDSTFRCTKV